RASHPPAPPPPPPPSARPRPSSPAPVPLPAYRRAQRAEPAGGPSSVTVMLVIMAPAVLAAAALRSRSSR
ncbi:hypothetical protein ACFT5C_34755, partial [Streptomyces sp. NPDC057116]|uniref:hypothetical protein n=1 Tax=Streptomyces sp. NPDC057116 TaxID=3346023 RepID=UPI00363FB29A